MCWLWRQESSATHVAVIVAAEPGHGAVHRHPSWPSLAWVLGRLFFVWLLWQMR